MKNITTVFTALSLSLIFVACGSSSDDKPAATTASTTWTNTTMQNLVMSKCATSGCHNGTEPTDFSKMTQAEFKAYTAARDRVAEGTMPAPSGLGTDDKVTFAKFFAN